MRKVPFTIAVVALLFLLTGLVTFGFHLSQAWARREFHSDIFLVLSLGVLAIVVGVFLLRGSNWARWLALAWLAFHVVVSALHSWQETIVHALLLVLIAWLLLRPQAARWFAAQENQPS